VSEAERLPHADTEVAQEGVAAEELLPEMENVAEELWLALLDGHCVMLLVEELLTVLEAEGSSVG